MKKKSASKGKSLYSREDLIEKITNNRDFAFSVMDEAEEGISDENKWIWNDKEIVMALVQHTGYALSTASDSLKKDKEIVMMAVSIDGGALKYADASLKKNKKIIMKAISDDGGAIQYADNAFKKDRKIVTKAVQRFKPWSSGTALEFVDQSLKKDKQIVKMAVKVNGSALKYADNSLKKDKDIVTMATKEYGLAFRYADQSLKKDRKMILMAVQELGKNLIFAPDDLKKDKKIVIAALNNDDQVLKYVDKSLKNDPEILALLKSDMRTRIFIDEHLGRCKYTGQVKNGKLHGKGTLKSSEGDVYSGNFKNNKFNGYGVLTYSFGTINEGEWKDGQLHGKGSTTRGGSKHTGQFKHGLYHGIHKLKTDRGNVIQEFENDELISQKSPDGRITYYIKNKKNLDKLLSIKDLTQIEEIYINTESFSPLSICFDKLNNQLDKFTQPRILLEYLTVENMASDKFQKKLFRFYQIDHFYNFCLPNIIIPEIEIKSAKQIIQIDSFIKNLIVSVYRSIAFAYEESQAYWRFAIYRNYKQDNKEIFEFMSNDYFNYEDINKMNQLNIKQHNDFCQLKLKNFDSKKYFKNMDWCDIFLSIQMEG